MPGISTCTDTITDNTNLPTKDDKYLWLDPDDKRRHMTDAEILRLKLKLDDSLLDEKGKEEFLTRTDDFHNIFSLRDEIGTCPFIEVHLKLKDETPFFIHPYPMREGHSKRNGQTRTFRYHSKRVDQLQFTGCPSQMKASKFVHRFVVIFEYLMRDYLRSTMLILL